MKYFNFKSAIEAYREDKMALSNFVWNFAGDHNRFTRQQLIEEMTGEKRPLVKCGVNALYSLVLEQLEGTEAKAEAEEAAPEFSGEEMQQLEDFITEGLEEAAQAEAAEAEPVQVDNAGSLKDAKIEVGMKVLCRKCQRAGEVIAIEGLTVTVLLEDGSKRRPCMSRFRKLYIAA